MLFRRPAYGLLAVVLSLPLLAAPGCSALSLSSGGPTEPTAPIAGKAIVEVRPDRKKPRTMEMALTSESRVMDALKASRKLKKFRRVNVSVLRSTPEGGRVRLECSYDNAKDVIVPENDYALLPGDYVVVTEDTSTVIDDMFSDISGPLKRMVR